MVWALVPGEPLAPVVTIVTGRTVRHLVDAEWELLTEPGDASACVDRAYRQVRDRACGADPQRLRDDRRLRRVRRQDLQACSGGRAALARWEHPDVDESQDRVRRRARCQNHS